MFITMGRRNLHAKSQDGLGGVWSQPEVLSADELKAANRINEIIRLDKHLRVYDSIELIASDLFTLEHPNLARSDSYREDFISSIIRQGDEFGVWVYYPWSSELVHFPKPDDYHRLRTYRFRDLLSKEDIQHLRTARIAMFGMSVGGNIILELVQNGIGGSLAIGDCAEVNIPNFGRAEFDMRDLGSSKLDSIAKSISYVDPFIQQQHFLQGINEESIANLAAFHPDIIGDEVDHMPSSALLRKFSSHNKLPYITASDVHDAVVLEVCRHDLGNSPLYASTIRDATADELIAGRLSITQQESLFAQSVGYRNLTPQIIKSGMEIGKTLSGIPQLGSTASASAGIATIAYREILLGNQQLKTKIYAVPLAKMLGMHIRPRDTIRTAVKYMQYRHNNLP